MSKLVILRGNSGSGKSTVARSLQRKIGRGTMVISQDCVRREMLWVKDEPENQAVSLLKNLLEYGYHNCPTVILEGILYSDYYKSLFEKAEELYNGRIHAYYFDLPFEETLKRHEHKQIAHEFGEIEMRRWWREKDAIPNISEKMILKDMVLDDIVSLICQDLDCELYTRSCNYRSLRKSRGGLLASCTYIENTNVQEDSDGFI